MAEEVALVGAFDPRLMDGGAEYVGLNRQRKAYRKADPPPTKVKPIPVTLVEHAVHAHQDTEFRRAVADLLIVGFFFLLRPGEHAYTKENNHPFRLQDVSFDTSQGTANAVLITPAALQTAIRVHLNFTTQKNGVPNEAITHGDTVDCFLSPMKAVRRRVQHLRAAGAPPDTPLHAVYLPGGSTLRVASGDLTKALRASCTAIGASLGLKYSDISARALRAGGAMALLRANVDSTTLRMVGRWKSWAMLEYLHRTALTTDDFATRMLTHGRFHITTHEFLPTDVLPLLAGVL